MEELTDIIREVYSYFTDDTLSKSEYDEFKSLLKDTIKTFYPEYNHILNNLDDILNMRYQLNELNFESINQGLDFDKKFITCEERDAFYDNNCNNPLIIDINKLTDAEKIIFNQYEYLKNLPQPVQKSKEWFDMRNNMVTASSCGAVIGECKYTTIKSVLIDKLGLGAKFKENKFVYHGKKYEKIAIMIYEIIYNSKVGEFGLIQHPELKYLGASPDGISMSLTLDGKINNLLGRMLEIKCPPSRKIQNVGYIKGDICPDYYWVQVQIQLECCNLPDCDFWQCHLVEYENETAFFEDPVDNLIHSDSQIRNQNEMTEILEEPEKVYIDRRIRKGAIIELLPIKRSIVPRGELPEWYGKYIYPPTILMTAQEYKDWATETIKNINTLYPEYKNDYKFSKIVYWKLELSHNELITRQVNWFESNKLLFERFWDRVIYYRNHLDEANEDIVEQRLSNDIFLNSTTIKIQKNNNKKNEIFIKPTNNEDIFLDSSDDKVKVKTKTKTKTKTKVEIKNNDIFLDSSEEKPKPKPKPKSIPVQIMDDNNELLDLVLITENRKKNNKKS